MRQYPFIFSDDRSYRIRRHVVFWVFWWLFFGFLYSYTAKLSLLPNLKRLPVSMVDSFFFLGAHAFLSYALIYFIAPRYILKGRYLSAAMLTAGCFIMTGCISAIIGNYILPEVRYYLFSIDFVHPTNESFLLALLAGLRGAITIGGIALAIKLMKYWYIKEQRNLQLQHENAEAQLQLLKAQVHPHFLFNTLNNIYARTQARSPEAARMITSLSGLLRYMLYEGNQPLVPLWKELKMAEDYISMEEIRYDNNPDIHIDLPQNTRGLYIAPLLLLPFVENCFKHGASHVLERPWINMAVTVKDRQLQMKLLNGKAPQTNKAALPGGIGIENIRKRLLLLYPGRHELTITSEPDVFIVNLKIILEQKEVPVMQTPEMIKTYG